MKQPRVLSALMVLVTSFAPIRATAEFEIRAPRASNGYGSPFQLFCKLHDVMIGADFFQQADGRITYLRAICESVDTGGNLGAGYGQSMIPADLPQLAGTAGTKQITCPAGWAVAGIAAVQTGAVANTESLAITTLNFACKQWSAPSQRVVGTAFQVLRIGQAVSAPIVEDHNFAGCPSDFPIRGIRGTVLRDARLSSVTMVCYTGLCPKGDATSCPDPGLL